MLSVEGWIYGIYFSTSFALNIIFGFVLIYQSKKIKAKLLFCFGLGWIFNGLAYLGNFVDFLTILLTGTNIDNSYGIVGILCWIWIPLISLMILKVYIEFLNLRHKKYLFSLVIILAIFAEISLFLNPMGSIWYSISEPGENVIRDNINLFSPLGIIFIILLFLMLVFGVVISLIKGILATGILRKKQIMMSIGAFFYLVIIFLLNFEFPFNIMIAIRYGIFGTFLILYLSLREEPEKPQERVKKEVKLEGNLFRISKRPDVITEEDVTFHKEKKICLVCKGKLLRSLYLCPKCDALYCDNCARTLANLENVCWVCDEPIDETKPIKIRELEDDGSIKIHKKD